MARTVQQFEIDHIEMVRQEYAEKTGTQSDIVQLTPGGLAYTGTWVEIPGIRLEWNCLDSRVRTREVQNDWGLLFGFALPGSSALNFRGIAVEDAMAAVYRQNTYMDYVGGPGVRTLIVCVQESFVEQRGWRLGAGSFRQVDFAKLSQLQSVCDRVTSRGEWNQSIEQTETGAVLDALEQALQPWMDTSTPPLPPKKGAFHFEVVEDAEKIWKEAGSRRPPPVRDLVEQIGIPERTLFHAFQEAVGMGPARYLKLLQLHRLRDRLLEANPASGSVADIADAQGFDQLGHMAADYKRHFLELPSQTLKRLI